MNYIFVKWQLSDLRPFMHIALTNNYVAIVYSAEYNRDVVLKVGLKNVIDQEIQALQYFKGNSCVKLLQFDQDASTAHSALLLEYVQPGSSLKDLFLQGKEEESITIFADLVKKMHACPQQYDDRIIETVAERLSLLHSFQSKNSGLMQLLLQAERLADKLIITQGKKYLLHGDLHHENILQCDDIWIMIDPQGIIGELEYEVGAFIRNPIFTLFEQQNLKQIIMHRFDRLTFLLDLDRQRMIDWSFVQAVLAACYSEQDNQDEALDYFILVAELLKKL